MNVQALVNLVFRLTPICETNETGFEYWFIDCIYYVLAIFGQSEMKLKDEEYW